MSVVCPHVTQLCHFHHSQMQPTHAALLSLRVGMGGASPTGGPVMDMTIVVMELMSCLKPAVCYFITADLRLLSTLKIKQKLNACESHCN